MSSKDFNSKEINLEIENINNEDQLSELNDDNISNDNYINNDDNEKNNQNNFKEKVLMYVKYDDLIRTKMEEIKELKNKRKPCEEFIINFLEKEDAPFVTVKSGKLIKNKSETKGSLKVDIIKSSILEGIKNEKITDDDTKYIKITADIMNLMEQKREKKVRTNLKRTFTKKKVTKTKNKKV